MFPLHHCSADQADISDDAAMRSRLHDGLRHRRGGAIDDISILNERML